MVVADQELEPDLELVAHNSMAAESSSDRNRGLWEASDCSHS